MLVRMHFESRPCAALAVLALLAAPVASSAVPRAALPDSAVHGRVYSVRDMPGYVPLVDPESASVRIGRRTNAPLVRQPFAGGAPALDALGKAILRQIAQHQQDSLLALCVTDQEFRDILWREFPQSRPATGLQWVDAWKILYARMHAGCLHAIRDYGRHTYAFVSITADSVMRYKNFTMYSKLQLTSRADGGELTTMTWLRAVVARKGAFKIYSTDD